MVLYNELPVYRDSYNLLLEIYKATNKFSHEYKYCLGQDMKRDVLNLFRSLYRANRAVEKHQPLEEPSAGRLRPGKTRAVPQLHSAKPAKKIFCRRLLCLLCGNRPNQGLDESADFYQKRTADGCRAVKTKRQ